MTAFVAILEDCPERVAEMRACLAELLPNHSPAFFDDAGEMLAWLAEHLPEVALISLDHDLRLPTDADDRRCDPGTGRMVADYLAGQPPVCPVIVHSSNDHFAPGMLQVLLEMEWPCRRVYPFDEHRWVRAAWAAEVRRLIAAGWIRNPIT
jgi:hypothetical protein